MLNILIVDNDKLIRLFLQGLLNRKLVCNIVEAENGLDALLYLEKNQVELVLLDIAMPVMDGLELLKVIRSTPQIAATPVIILSSSDESETVMKLIQLGITDYILKPFKNRMAIFERISNALKSIKEKSTEKEAEQARTIRPGLLLMDKDPNFRSYFMTLFSDKFSIEECGSGSEGLKKYLDAKPEIVCIGQGLPVVDENFVASKIVLLDSEKRTKIFYFYDETSEDARKSSNNGAFHASLKKSFVPATFRNQFLHMMLGDLSENFSFVDVLKNQLTSELITAVRLTFGLLTCQEVHLLPKKAIEDISFDKLAIVDLFNEQERIELSLGVILPNNDYMSLIKRIEGLDESQSMAKLLETISGRLVNSLSARGYYFEQIGLRTNLNYHEMGLYELKLLYPFESDQREKIIVTILMKG